SAAAEEDVGGSDQGTGTGGAGQRQSEGGVVRVSNRKRHREGRVLRSLLVGNVGDGWAVVDGVERDGEGSTEVRVGGLPIADGDRDGGRADRVGNRSEAESAGGIRAGIGDGRVGDQGRVGGQG